MKNLTITLINAMLLSFCSYQEQDPKEPIALDLSGLDLSELNFEFNEFKVPVEETEKLKFYQDVLSELREAIEEDDEIDYFTFFVSVQNNEQAILKDIIPRKFDIRASDPDPFGRCLDGWDLVGIGTSPEEVEALVAEGFEDVGGLGSCAQVQVDVGLLGASVCSRDC